MIRFVENRLKIIHYVVKARRRQEEYLDINTATNKTRFSRVCNDHAGDDSEFAQCNFSETLKKQVTKALTIWDCNFIGRILVKPLYTIRLVLYDFHSFM